MRCPECGAENREGTETCGSCGANLIAQRPPAPPTRLRPRTSGLAIASLVLGIMGVFCWLLTALPGLVLGIVALSKINHSEGKLTGSGLAIAGICTSAVFLLFSPMAVALLLPAISARRAQALEAASPFALHELSSAMVAYELDHGRYPDASRWCDELYPAYLADKRVFRGPDAEATRCAYAMNEHLSEKAVESVRYPSRTVLLFESDLGWNGSGGRADLPEQPHHPGGHVILFADGHVEAVSVQELDHLVWRPGSLRSLTR